MAIDWTECAAIEAVPGRMGGQPVLKHTRVRPGDLLVNRSERIDWLIENFGVEREAIRQVFAFHDARTAARLLARTARNSTPAMGAE